MPIKKAVNNKAEEIKVDENEFQIINDDAENDIEKANFDTVQEDIEAVENAEEMEVVNEQDKKIDDFVIEKAVNVEISQVESINIPMNNSSEDNKVEEKSEEKKEEIKEELPEQKIKVIPPTLAERREKAFQKYCEELGNVSPTAKKLVGSGRLKNITPDIYKAICLEMMKNYKGDIGLYGINARKGINKFFKEMFVRGRLDGNRKDFEFKNVIRDNNGEMSRAYKSILFKGMNRDKFRLYLKDAQKNKMSDVKDLNRLQFLNDMRNSMSAYNRWATQNEFNVYKKDFVEEHDLRLDDVSKFLKAANPNVKQEMKKSLNERTIKNIKLTRDKIENILSDIEETRETEYGKLSDKKTIDFSKEIGAKGESINKDYLDKMSYKALNIRQSSLENALKESFIKANIGSLLYIDDTDKAIQSVADNLAFISSQECVSKELSDELTKHVDNVIKDYWEKKNPGEKFDKEIIIKAHKNSDKEKSSLNKDSKVAFKIEQLNDTVKVIADNKEKDKNLSPQDAFIRKIQGIAKNAGHGGSLSQDLKSIAFGFKELKDKDNVYDNSILANATLVAMRTTLKNYYGSVLATDEEYIRDIYKLYNKSLPMEKIVQEEEASKVVVEDATEKIAINVIEADSAEPSTEKELLIDENGRDSLDKNNPSINDEASEVKNENDSK